jgi:hypothetical protein
MKIISGAFNANVWRENIFKPTIGNDSLRQESNDIGVRIMNVAYQQIWLLKARCSPIEIFMTPRLLLMGRLTTRLITS